MTAFCGRGLCGQPDGGAIGCDIFLHDHGIRAFGQQGSGENPGGLSGLQRLARRTASLALANQGPRSIAVGKADRIAVHRRHVGSRLLAFGNQVSDDIAAECVVNGKRFGGQAGSQRDQSLLRFGKRQQCAHSATQSPDFPPLLESSLISRITISFCIALDMS